MWIWLIVAILAALGEVVTYDLFLASVAAAAAVTAVLALVLPWGVLQVTIFAALSLVGITLVRPAVKHALGIESVHHLTPPASNIHLSGKRGTVTADVTAASGQVRMGLGEFWSARSYNPEQSMPIGSEVEVVLVDGLTALVEPAVPALPPASTAGSKAHSEKGS